MTERENFFKVYNHEKPEWIPNFFTSYSPMGCSLLNNQGEYMKGGKDMFGCEWICTEDTGWQAIADPKKHILDIDDIEHWRDIITFPDLDEMDWEGAAKRDLQYVDRENKVFAMFGMEGNFNRLQAMMGTCDALVAMLEEPEAVADFFDAHTRFKMKTIEKIAKYYKPDIYVNGDDVCSADGLFFSKSMYDELIKPYEKMLAQTAVKNGMIVEHHVCGNCEAIIEDIIDSGATIWQTAQPMNNLVEIEKKYGDRLLIHGGWDSTAPYNYANCDEESVRQGVRDALDRYMNNGHYMLFPVVMGDRMREDIANRMHWISDECTLYSKKLLNM